MPIVDFPFIKTGRADSRPALFVRLVGPGGIHFQDTIGLVDTGASSCCVPMGYANILGLDPAAGTSRLVRTANGISKAYEYNTGCEIKVWDTNEYYNDRKVLAYDVLRPSILFMPDLTDVLLGVAFLDEKILTIDYKRKVFSLL